MSSAITPLTWLTPITNAPAAACAPSSAPRRVSLSTGSGRRARAWPCWQACHDHRAAGRVKGFLVVEMNSGQMVQDVRLAVNGRVPVQFYGRMGGTVPYPDELLEAIE